MLQWGKAVKLIWGKWSSVAVLIQVKLVEERGGTNLAKTVAVFDLRLDGEEEPEGAGREAVVLI